MCLLHQSSLLCVKGLDLKTDTPLMAVPPKSSLHKSYSSCMVLIANLSFLKVKSVKILGEQNEYRLLDFFLKFFIPNLLWP